MTLFHRPVRLLVSGSRDWTERTIIRLALAQWVDDREVVVVHGGAQGADKIADQVAAELGLDREVHEANWVLHGRSAGPIRNRAMFDTGIDYLLAFHKLNSRGTAHAISEAKKRGVPYTRWIVGSAGYPATDVEQWAPESEAA